MYEARSINVKTLLEVFSATFSELFRCRFKSSILGALTFSASHRVWFRHGLTSFYTHTHTRYNVAFDFTFPVSFCIHILLGKPLCRGKCTYIHASFRGISNSFVFLGTSGSYDSLGREKSRLLWRANEIVWSPGGSQIIMDNVFACLLLRCVKAIIIPCIIHPSSIPSSIFRILHFARVKIANIFTPLPCIY